MGHLLSAKVFTLVFFFNKFVATNATAVQEMERLRIIPRLSRSTMSSRLVAPRQLLVDMIGHFFSLFTLIKLDFVYGKDFRYTVRVVISYTCTLFALCNESFMF